MNAYKRPNRENVGRVRVGTPISDETMTELTAGMSREEIAGMCGVSVHAVSAWKARRYFPKHALWLLASEYMKRHSDVGPDNPVVKFILKNDIASAKVEKNKTTIDMNAEPPARKALGHFYPTTERMSTEQLVEELEKRGWKVTLTRKGE